MIESSTSPESSTPTIGSPTWAIPKQTRNAADPIGLPPANPRIAVTDGIVIGLGATTAPAGADGTNRMLDRGVRAGETTVQGANSASGSMVTPGNDATGTTPPSCTVST